MKYTTTHAILRRLSLCCLLSAVSTAQVQAQTVTDFRLSHESELTLSGHATLTDWECATPRIAGSFQLPLPIDSIERFFDFAETHAHDQIDRFVADLAIPHANTTEVHLEVFIDNLECGNNAMESDLREALRGDVYPAIRYSFRHIAAISPPDDRGTAAATLHTEGQLTVGGVQRDVVMDVEIARASRGVYRLTGIKNISMLDYQVTPPTALFGLIRADHQVAIAFDVTVDALDAQSASTHVSNRAGSYAVLQ